MALINLSLKFIAIYSFLALIFKFIFGGVDIFKNSEYVCGFTGHRPNKMPDGGDETSSSIIKIKQGIYENIIRAIDLGYKDFISGMGMGFDIWAAECVIELSQSNDISLICAIPNLGQTRHWSKSWRDRYDSIIKKASHTFCLHDRYCVDSYFIRNRFIVDNSSLIICYMSHNKGGTAYTYKYALEKGLSIVNILDSDQISFL